MIPKDENKVHTNNCREPSNYDRNGLKIRAAEKQEIGWINDCYDQVEFIHSHLDNKNLEQIESPITTLKKIGINAGRNDIKSFSQVKSLVNNITILEIIDVYESKKVPSFNKFWDFLVSLHQK